MTAVNPATNSLFSDIGLAMQQPAAKKQQLGQDEFLRLMTEQLKNQDPFKPMESGEFLGQIAQFSTVSGIQQMQASLSDLAGALQSSQALQGAALVGRGVLVPSAQGYLPAEGAMSAAAELESSGDLVVDVTDSAGQIVRRLEFGAQPAGLAYFQWDGLDASGARLPEGSYSINARVVQGNSAQSVSTLAVGIVGSVSLAADGLSLNLLGLDPVKLAEVRQIL